MYNFGNFLICILVLLSNAFLIKCRPVQVEFAEGVPVEPQISVHLPLDVQRVERQVVQPAWLTEKNDSPLPVDGTVRITQKNLQETAALRAEILKAVKEGRYYIDMDQSDFSNQNQNSMQSDSQLPSLQQPPTQFDSVPAAPPMNQIEQQQLQQQEQQQAQQHQQQHQEHQQEPFVPSPPANWGTVQVPPQLPQQPPQFGPSQFSPWHPTQWPRQFQQQPQLQPQPGVFGSYSPLTPWNPSQWVRQFELPRIDSSVFMQPRQSNPMQQMWTRLFG